MSLVLNINDEDIVNTLVSKSAPNKLVAILFTEWCDACTEFREAVYVLSQKFKESATFLRVDIEKCPAIAKKFAVLRHPTCILAKGGHEVDRCIGSAGELTEKIVSWTAPKFQGNGKPLGEGRNDKLPGSKAGGWFSFTRTWFKKSVTPAQAQEMMGVDDNLPQVQIQIRLVDGTRFKMTLNVSQPVSKIREFLLLCRPEFAKKHFLLMSSFPRKTITDENATIENSDLGHSIVMQKLARA